MHTSCDKTLDFLMAIVENQESSLGNKNLFYHVTYIQNLDATVVFSSSILQGCFEYFKRIADYGLLIENHFNCVIPFQIQQKCNVYIKLNYTRIFLRKIMV